MATIEKTIQTDVKIIKLDDEHRHVFGIFSVSKIGDELVADHEDDEIDPDTLETAAYNHVLNARVAGENHDRTGVGDLIESMVFTPEKMAAMTKAFADTGITVSIDIPAVAWWGGYYVHDDTVWKAVKAGKYVSFSVGGTAVREMGEAA